MPTLEELNVLLPLVAKKWKAILMEVTTFFQICPTLLYCSVIDCPCDLTTSFGLHSILSQLGEGLVYEAVDGSNVFPHFYGPSRSFSPLTFDAVTKAEKLTLSGGRFSCSFLT